MNIKVYDNHGETIDRYTAVYLDRPESKAGHYEMLALSDAPYHPLGFCQHTSGQDGPHLGDSVSLELLPKDIQRAILEG